MTPFALAARLVIAAIAPFALAGAPAPVQAGSEVVAQISIHGNDATPDQDIVRLSGAIVGMPFGPTTLADVAARLRDSHKFLKVDVLKRFASISDPSQIALIIVVDEGPVSVKVPDDPRAPATFTQRHGLTHLMFVPILDAEDGYAFTYGVRFALRDVGAQGSRVFVPLSWGGRRQAGLEYEKTLNGPIITRVSAGADLVERTNPFFSEIDNRRQVSGRLEHASGPLRIGATAGWQQVSFGGVHDAFRSIGADVAFDTRLDPLLPRNAVFVSAAWDRLAFDSQPSLVRGRYDARGYVGFIRQTVLVLRLVREDATAPLPDYLKPLLGGADNLRGFRAGLAAGDVLVAGTAELRIPLSSALSIGRVGVSLFVDKGEVYDYGRAFDRRRLKTGAGGSVWVTAAMLQVSLSVAHGEGAGTRVQFSGGFGF